MDILFVGGVFTGKQEKEIIEKSKSVVQFAANTLQWNLINGLDQCNNKPVSILNAVFIGSYPFLYKDFYIKGYRWKHTDESDDVNLGFLNIFGIKRIWQGISAARFVVKWVKNGGSKDKKAVIIYSMNTSFIFATAVAKKLYPRLHACVVVADLPQYMNQTSRNSGLFRLLRNIDSRICSHYLKKIDSFVLLTKYMKEPLGVGTRPWVVVEGVIDPGELMPARGEANDGSNDKNIILYAGTLNRKYGIINLLNAFSLIESSKFELWICGAGEAEKEIKEQMENDNRIKYFGQMERAEVLKLQRDSSVLINPRGNEGEFTKYSFPSKIMEYMLSGTPVIIKKLHGVPEEYYKYLFVIDGNTDSDMTEKIIEVCSLSKQELYEAGRKAQEFVLENKNGLIQCSKIIDMINARTLE